MLNVALCVGNGKGRVLNNCNGRGVVLLPVATNVMPSG